MAWTASQVCGDAEDRAEDNAVDGAAFLRLFVYIIAWHQSAMHDLDVDGVDVGVRGGACSDDAP